ncbi:MAG: CapA family protein [Eubacteriales bacterium]|nr:CapA family protein [Eubacteriales bacterium]
MKKKYILPVMTALCAVCIFLFGKASSVSVTRDQEGFRDASGIGRTNGDGAQEGASGREAADVLQKASGRGETGGAGASEEAAFGMSGDAVGGAASGDREKSRDRADAARHGEDILVTLGFAGDVNLSEGWETTEKMDGQKNGILDCFSEKTVERMRGFDLFMLNNEFTYSTRGKKSQKTYTFRADPDRVENLKKLGVDIVLTANNHINDYGTDAFLDTLDTLDRAGIRRVGAGKDLKEAASPVYIELYGRKIAYVAASCAEEHEDTIWTTPAEKDSPGILGCYDPEAFCESVREAAEQADFVIASVHWGYEYLDYYTAEQKEMAKSLIGAGADAVIGTHPHVLQGVEYLDGAPVFYSLGNFWFNGEDLMTGMAQLTLRLPEDPEEKVRLEETKFIPCTQTGLYTKEAESDWERDQILQHMRDISFGSEIMDDGTVLP